jgi:ubiquitin-protein ligase
MGIVIEEELTVNPPEGITAGPISEDNFFEWEALISGPEDTPFEGGVFPALLTFPKDYPLNPPSMRFVCDLFHPNGNPKLKSMIKCILTVEFAFLFFTLLAMILICTNQVQKDG